MTGARMELQMLGGIDVCTNGCKCIQLVLISVQGLPIDLWASAAGERKTAARKNEVLGCGAGGGGGWQQGG